ncbi:MAG: nitrilase [Phycisphaerae bacterium]|nr:MAG: nitrilase [Phycisphaerae bacterium]
MKVAIAQIAPVFMNRDATTARVVASIEQASKQDCALVAFGESLIPAYPFWLSKTGGAQFNDDRQKAWHAMYLEQAVVPEEGHLDSIANAAKRANIAVVVGIAERPLDRGGHTIYCSRVFISNKGEVLSIHRKLMPTYEERLAWGMGDGAGLVTHRVGPFTVGALNCWENWMPLARTALYAQGENLHVAIWPGSAQLTADITRFIALESRSFVVSAGAMLREGDLPNDLPDRDTLANPGEMLFDGGSCIAAPDGSWLVEPVVGREDLIVCDLDHQLVFKERQNFDPTGHYSRPDVLRLKVDRNRNATLEE